MKNQSEQYVLHLEGALTIRRVQELKEVLLQALNKTDHLVITFSKVVDLDFAGIQALYAASIMAHHQKKNFSARGEVPERIQEVFKICGLTNRSWIEFLA